MRQLRALLLTAAFVLPLPAHAAPGDNINAVIVHFFKALNAGDGQDFASVFTGQASITDAFAPFVWQGQGAAGHYFTDLKAGTSAAGVTDVKLTAKPPKNPIVASDGFGYAPIPVDISFKLNGEAKTQTGVFILGLQQVDTSWAIASAAWVYTK